MDGLEARLERFFARRAAGIKPGLGTIHRLLKALDHPERAAPVVHVAGTNGKGSTCAAIEAQLRRAGLKTGMFTSPHLVRFNERIRIDGQEISDASLAELAADLEEVDARRNPDERPATFFELSTAMAYEAFRRAKVDVSVIEVGLGGRWDATNVITPVVSVITRIGYDHTDYLGDRLHDIANEKAGIIKREVPVVASPQDPEAAIVLESIAAARFSPLTWSQPEDVPDKLREAWPLPGAHQRENLATAIHAADLALASLGRSLSPSERQNALASVHWPARFQILQSSPILILDAAHNPAGATALRQTLDALHAKRKVAWVMAFMADKDAPAMLAILRERMDAAWLVPLDMRRAAEADQLQAWVPMATVCPLSEAMAASLAWAAEQDAIVCVAGSLYLAGEVLKWQRDSASR